MMTLFVVAVLLCRAGEDCIPDPLPEEAYLSLEDCEKRAHHLAGLNPGTEFACGVVMREEKETVMRRTSADGSRVEIRGRSTFVM